MSQERCAVWDLPVESCACPKHRGGGQPEQAIDPDAPWIQQGYGFEARFPAVCPACDEEIETGMDIRRSQGRYIHVECVEKS